MRPRGTQPHVATVSSLVATVIFVTGCMPLQETTSPTTTTTHQVAVTSPARQLTGTPTVPPTPTETPAASDTLTPSSLDPCTRDGVGSIPMKPILLISNRDGKPALYSIYPDGSGLRKLATEGASPTSPSWSNDGSHLAYVSESDIPKLFVANPDGSSPIEMLPDAYSVGQFPDLSNLQTGETPTPKEMLSNSDLPWFEWSPDDSVIAARIVGDDIGSIVAVDVQTRSLTDLFPPDVIDGPAFSWSPTGNAMVAEAQMDARGAVRGLLITSIGNEHLTYVPLQSLSVRIADWNPGGQSVLYVDRPNSQTDQLAELNVSDLSRTMLYAGVGRILWGVWSSSGQAIAFSEASRETPVVALKLLSLVNGTLKTLAEGTQVDGYHFAWASDGIHLAYIDDNNGSPSLFISNVCSGESTLVLQGVSSDRISWRP